MENTFASQLLHWHAENARILPWKETTDPYRIWLSEIILQQTRVDQGMPFYLRFVKKFPTIFDLASAEEDEVLKLWEGLGYYSRARNLLATAKEIVHQFGGQFPKDYNALMKLKGVGEYTAAAIASFAFNLPHAVVDGNVTRVIARYLAIDDPVDRSPTKKAIKSAADLLLDKETPAAYNQAILDFGATLCTPKNPTCVSCPVHDSCSSYRKGLVNKIPQKSKKIQKIKRVFHYHVFNDGLSTLIFKRHDNDIWKGLYEYYLVEGGDSGMLKEIPADELPFIRKMQYVFSDRPVSHILTHQLLEVWFHNYEVEFNKKAYRSINGNFYLVENKKLPTFAFPRVIQKHVIDKKCINNNY